MASFQAKNRLEREQKEIKQKLSLRFLPTRRVIYNSQKIAIKFKQLKYTITASLQAKIGWKRRRKRKNENYRSVPFLYDV